MPKIKLTKTEQRAQREALAMYERYLPTLTLKKQQLQTEMRTIQEKAEAVRAKKKALEADFESWIAVFSESGAFGAGMVTVKNIRRGTGNIAGVVIPVYEGADFARGTYDLYDTPLWVDAACDRMEEALALDLEAQVLDEQVWRLAKELRTTTQRVNLFEKIMIPRTRENIKRIAIFLGDQEVNAVVRSKIAKRKLEQNAASRAARAET